MVRKYGVRLIMDEIYHGLTFGSTTASAGLQRQRHHYQFLFEIFLHDGLASWMDGYP